MVTSWTIDSYWEQVRLNTLSHTYPVVVNYSLLHPITDPISEPYDPLGDAPLETTPENATTNYVHWLSLTQTSYIFPSPPPDSGPPPST